MTTLATSTALHFYLRQSIWVDAVVATKQKRPAKLEPAPHSSGFQRAVNGLQGQRRAAKGRSRIQVQCPVLYAVKNEGRCPSHARCSARAATAVLLIVHVVLLVPFIALPCYLARWPISTPTTNAAPTTKAATPAGTACSLVLLLLLLRSVMDSSAYPVAGSCGRVNATPSISWSTISAVVRTMQPGITWPPTTLHVLSEIAMCR